MLFPKVVLDYQGQARAPQLLKWFIFVGLSVGLSFMNGKDRVKKDTKQNTEINIRSAIKTIGHGVS